MAVVFFGRRSVANPIREASTNSIVDPIAGYVNSRHRTQGRENSKRNSLLNLDFAERYDTRDTNATKDNHQNITMKAAKTNKLWSLMTPKSRPAERKILGDAAHVFCGPIVAGLVE
jgi:hypothetical protein